MPRTLAAILIYAHSPLLAQELLTLDADTVTIHCPEEVELTLLVDYVGRALDVRFLYGEELKTQRVELRPSPVVIPKGDLFDLLASLLRVRELALIEESPGFFRIIRAESASRSVSALLPANTSADGRSRRLVTQVFRIPGGKVEGLSEKLGRFLSSPKDSVVTIPESGLLIVTDVESRIAFLKEIVSLFEGSVAEILVRTFSSQGADSTVLAGQVSTILADAQRLRQDKSPTPTVRGDVLAGSVLIIGTPMQIAEGEALLRQLIPPGVELATRSYGLRNLSIERAKKLIEHVAIAPGQRPTSPTSVYADTEGGRLYVTADAATHAAVAGLLEREDHLLPEAQRPFRIYAIKNRKAAGLLATLTQLLGESAEFIQPFESNKSDFPRRPLGPNRPPAPTGVVQIPPAPPSGTSEVETTARPALARVRGDDYVLTADEHTNSILAVASKEFHAQLAALIDELDHRRPQVLIEMTLVAITMNDRLEVGAELEALDLGDAWDYLVFSSFGLSQIDPSTGRRTLTPGVGANGILLGPDEAPLVVRALATKGKARVLSTPKLLVSDNAKGTLRNVDEAPFTSVNASDTVATTSFAGFESAGTTLSVTPHISEDEHLNLEYELTFSNFTGSSSAAAVPPPRTTNSLSSVVVVPDGYTVVTGGLVVDNDSNSASKVPLLGDIPGVGRLFQNHSRTKSQTKIFAFIRPTIVRDDEFAALKNITLKEIEGAGVLDNGCTLPEPLWMK